MTPELLAQVLFFLTGGLSYLTLAIFVFRNSNGIWMRMTISVLIFIAAVYGFERAVCTAKHIPIPTRLLEIQRFVVNCNGITAMLALVGVLKERKRQ